MEVRACPLVVISFRVLLVLCSFFCEPDVQFYYDPKTSNLYYFHNASGAPPTDLVFTATNLKTVVSITGTKAAPAKGITVRGVTLTAAAYTCTLPTPHLSPSPLRLIVYTRRPPLVFAFHCSHKTWTLTVCPAVAIGISLAAPYFSTSLLSQ